MILMSVSIVGIGKKSHHDAGNPLFFAVNLLRSNGLRRSKMSHQMVTHLASKCATSGRGGYAVQHDPLASDAARGLSVNAPSRTPPVDGMTLEAAPTGPRGARFPAAGPDRLGRRPGRRTAAGPAAQRPVGRRVARLFLLCRWLRKNRPAPREIRPQSDTFL